MSEKKEANVTLILEYPMGDYSDMEEEGHKISTDPEDYGESFMQSDVMIGDMNIVGVRIDRTGENRATEFEYFKWFRHNADFGPGEGDVIHYLNERFKEESGKQLPEGWEE